MPVYPGTELLLQLYLLPLACASILMELPPSPVGTMHVIALTWLSADRALFWPRSEISEAAAMAFVILVLPKNPDSGLVLCSSNQPRFFEFSNILMWG
jgi:hypothetical protein